MSRPSRPDPTRSPRSSTTSSAANNGGPRFKRDSLQDIPRLDLFKSQLCIAHADTGTTDLATEPVTAIFSRQRRGDVKRGEGLLLGKAMPAPQRPYAPLSNPQWRRAVVRRLTNRAGGASALVDDEEEDDEYDNGAPSLAPKSSTTTTKAAPAVVNRMNPVAPSTRAQIAVENRPSTSTYRSTFQNKANTAPGQRAFNNLLTHRELAARDRCGTVANDALNNVPSAADRAEGAAICAAKKKRREEEMAAIRAELANPAAARMTAPSPRPPREDVQPKMEKIISRLQFEVAALKRHGEALALEAKTARGEASYSAARAAGEAIPEEAERSLSARRSGQRGAGPPSTLRRIFA